MATPQSTAAAKVIKALFALATIVYQTVYLYKAVQKNPSPYFEERQQKRVLCNRSCGTYNRNIKNNKKQRMTAIFAV